jgi:hypothetical protein
MEKMSKIDEQAFSMKVMEFSVWISRQHGATDEVYKKSYIYAYTPVDFLIFSPYG